MMWIIGMLVAFILFCMTYEDVPCERVELGYNCKGKTCECRKVNHEIN